MEVIIHRQFLEQSAVGAQAVPYQGGYEPFTTDTRADADKRVHEREPVGIMLVHGIYHPYDAAAAEDA